MHGPGDVRIEDLDVPPAVEPTDAIIKITVACTCGSDPWSYRGPGLSDGRPMGHKYVGIVTKVGDAVKDAKISDFAVESFCPSDNTCEIYRPGCQSRYVNGDFVQGTQTQYARIPLANGTLVVVPGGRPKDEAAPASLLAISDVLGTGWFGAVAADAGPSKTIIVVGDGAVGLMTVLAAKQLDVERIVAMSHYGDRTVLAQEFGATDVVTERGDARMAAAKELTGSLGARSVVGTVGTQESVIQAIGACRPDGYVEYVDVSHDVSPPGQELSSAEVNLLGGLAPVRRFPPDLVDRVLKGRIDPGKVFNLVLPLDGVTEGYKAMDERCAVKVLPQP